MSAIRKDGTATKPKADKRKIKREVIHKIQMGFDTDKEIKEWIMEEYGYTWWSAKLLFEECNRDVKNSYEKYLNGIAERNIKRLNAIIDKCDQEGRVKDQLNAIDMLNKISGLYTQKVEMNTKEDIEITFA